MCGARGQQNLPCSHHVLEAQPGVDYGYEDTELLHEALRPRLEKEDWSNV